MVYGTAQKINGVWYDAEPIAEGRTVVPVHSHNNTESGVGSAGWSRLDRELKGESERGQFQVLTDARRFL
jgi:hypothetical protein